ncbi:MAG: hypothetical protein C4532_02590 [Candidatus Abyssobacteria bacterium SURF_17]|uniref:Uncharacterized protein n=1 Tax=Candidatus Abyssobacteria bacterium SURF_17 TaxID=2093361 RepID=A0A419F7P9_9BACT|nr:MAG: hypothetical protein C4532_02590 [Candidatus Abyssubacteria bacterium SURF_17]
MRIPNAFLNEREGEGNMAGENSKKMTVPEHKLAKIHRGHENHLCELTAKRQMEKVGKLAKNAQYVCHICGRASAKAANLCEAVDL